MTIYNDCICKAFYEPSCEVHGPKRPSVCSHEVLVNDNVGNGGKWRCASCGKEAKQRSKEQRR